jgi:hypothetical protein
VIVATLLIPRALSDGWEASSALAVDIAVIGATAVGVHTTCLAGRIRADMWQSRRALTLTLSVANPAARIGRAASVALRRRHTVAALAELTCAAGVARLAAAAAGGNLAPGMTRISSAAAGAAGAGYGLAAIVNGGTTDLAAACLAVILATTHAGLPAATARLARAGT